MNAKHPTALIERIRNVMNAEGGIIPFSRFMSMALYEPELGYYMGLHEKFGPKGDFVTAPLVSPMYAQTLARSVLDDVRAYPHVIEWGAGNGQLAKDMLTAWEKEGLYPSYTIYDVSPACRAMQRETLAEFSGQVRWVEVPPESFRGVIIANEVLDALPVDLFHYREGKLWEHAVTWEQDHFAFVDREPAWTMDIDLPSECRNDYISERPLYADVVFQQWLTMLKAGKLVVIDYGFLAHEYYHPERSRGTLMCHYQHTAHENPLINVGMQDITAHVNFSDLIALAKKAGFETTFYTQAQFLIQHGLLELAQAAFTENIVEQRGISQAIRWLLEPQEMGEMFKVLVVCA